MNNRAVLMVTLVIGIIFLSIGVFNQSQKNLSGIPVGCMSKSLTGEIDFNERNYILGEVNENIPQIAFAQSDSVVLGSESDENKWIDVDLSSQTLTAWEGGGKFLETKVSTGLPYFPTPQGEFRIWIKLRAAKMEGGIGKYYYYLPNVPYVMFFENSEIPGIRGYGLHGTYWHNDFGTPRSYGCVNLPTNIAEKLYYWATPVLVEGRWSAKATSENLGTRVVIHE